MSESNPVLAQDKPSHVVSDCWSTWVPPPQSFLSFWCCWIGNWKRSSRAGGSWMLLNWKSGEKGFAQILRSEPLQKRSSVIQLWALAQLTFTIHKVGSCQWHESFSICPVFCRLLRVYLEQHGVWSFYMKGQYICFLVATSWGLAQLCLS